MKMKRFLVGVAGFEPAASCSQSRRDNRATLHPVCGYKYKNLFCNNKQLEQIEKKYFSIGFYIFFVNKIFNKSLSLYFLKNK